MNQRLVESVAQTILAMSDEERRLLEQKLNTPDTQKADWKEADKSSRVAEISRDIYAYEEKYHSSSNPNQSLSEDGSAQTETSENKTLYSFFKLASQMNIEGPADWSENIDHYLYGTPKVQND